MPQAQAFKLENLASIDGHAADGFEKELKRIVEDCMERPLTDGKREVSLHVRIKPEPDKTGDCTRVELLFFVKSKMPARESDVFHPRVKKTGQLVFDFGESEAQ